MFSHVLAAQTARPPGSVSAAGRFVRPPGKLSRHRVQRLRGRFYRHLKRTYGHDPAALRHSGWRDPRLHANGSVGGDQAASAALPVRAKGFLLQRAIDQFARARHEMNTWRSSLQVRWLADQALHDTRAAVSSLQQRPTSVRVRSHVLKQEKELQGQCAALESIATASLWRDPRLRLRDPEWNRRFMELPGDMPEGEQRWWADQRLAYLRMGLHKRQAFRTKVLAACSAGWRGVVGHPAEGCACAWCTGSPVVGELEGTPGMSVQEWKRATDLRERLLFQRTVLPVGSPGWNRVVQGERRDVIYSWLGRHSRSCTVVEGAGWVGGDGQGC